MAQNNLARQAVPMKPLRVANPERPIHTTTGAQTLEVPEHLNLSKFEKCLMTLGTVAVLCMMVWLVSLKIGVSTAQQNLQDVNASVTAVQTKNVSTKQEVNELQNRARLDKVAQKDGLTLSNGKIRNVNK